MFLGRTWHKLNILRTITLVNLILELKMFTSKVVVPTDGAAIEIDAKGKLQVPNNPIVPFIRGDGIGADITPVMKKVVDAAVAKAKKDGYDELRGIYQAALDRYNKLIKQ